MGDTFVKATGSLGVNVILYCTLERLSGIINR